MANAFYPATAQAQPSAPMMQSMPQNPAYQMVDSPAIAREVATVQSQIIIAKRFPRDESYSLQKIAQACSREKLANSAVYAYAKGGTNVTGASIRLAEAVATAWGNVKYGFEETDNEGGISTVRAYAYDMEANTQAERIYKVPHIRHTRGGDSVITDPREIYELVANQSARRVRACILEVIPADVVEYAMDVCEKTRTSSVSITPDALDKMCESFSQYHVSKMQIEAFIQRNLNAITTTQFLRLRDIFASLRDGMASAEDFFRSEDEIRAEKGGAKEEPAPQQTAEAPRKAQRKKAEEKPAPAPQEEPVAPQSAYQPSPDAVPPESFMDDGFNF